MEIREMLLIQTNMLREREKDEINFCYKSERLITKSDERFAIICGDNSPNEVG